MGAAVVTADAWRAERAALPWQDGLRARLRRGISANAVAQGLNVAAQLLLVPLFLVHWGPERYGQWLLLGAIPSALALADVGLATAAGQAMVGHVARDERARVQAITRGLAAWWLLVAVVVWLAGALLAAMPSTWLEAIGIAASSRGAYAVPAALLAAYALLGVLSGLLIAPLTAFGRYALGVHAGTALRVAELGATAAAVVASPRLDVLCAALVASRLLGIVALAMLLARFAPWVSWRPSLRAAWQDRALAASGIGFLAFPLGNALMNQGVLLALGGAVGAAAVAAFAVLRSLTRLVSQCLNVVIQAVQPEVTHAHSRGDVALMRLLCRRTTGVALRIGGAACAAIVLAGSWFITRWTHGTVAIDRVLLVELALAQAVTSVWLASAIAAAGTNQHRRMSVRFVALSLVAVAASGAAARVAGPRGAAGVLIVVELMMARSTIVEACRLLVDRPRAYLAAALGGWRRAA